MMIRTNTLAGKQRANITIIAALLLALAALLPLSQGWFPSSGSLMATGPLTNLGKLPLSFEPNAGQTDPSVHYLVHASGGLLYFTSSGVSLSLQGKQGAAAAGLAQGVMQPAVADVQHNNPDVVHLNFVGANPNARISNDELLPGKVNYFLGSDPAQWHTNLPTYAGITYSELYPGINLSYTGINGQLKGTYTLSAGADPSLIKWRYAGAAGISVDTSGNLQIRTAATTGASATLTEQAPVAWQEFDGKHMAVSARYLVSAVGDISIALGNYSKAHPLIIDPVLTYSTYLGGSGLDTAYRLTVDTSGNIYVAGETASTNFPLVNPYQPTNHGSNDMFVSKLNPSGSALLFSTYIGGSGHDYVIRVVVDGSGNAYLTGSTTSTNFPTQNAIQSAYGGGVSDIYATKLSSTGSSLVYSTYLGGNNADYGDDLTIDAAGNLYVTGEAASANYPIVNAYQPTLRGGIDIVVTKINPAGSGFVFSTFLGGSGFDEGFGIKLDGSGNIYLTGATTSSDYPRVNPIQASYGGGSYDSFLTKMNAAGSALVYSTYLGGNSADVGWGLAVDTSGSAYVDGYTSSSNYPTFSPFQSTNHGGYDMFISKVNAAGSAFDYSTYLGGSSDDLAPIRVVDLTINGQGAAYVVGASYSTNFPTANPIQATNAGGVDAVIAKFNPAGSALIYSTYLGGSGTDAGYGITTDGAGNVYISGDTSSANFPTVNPYQPNNAGGTDAFVAKIADEPPPTVTPTATSTDTPVPPTATPTFVPVNGCQFAILSFSPCTNANGCVEYSIPLQNEANSAVIISGTVLLKARGDEVIGEASIPPTYVGPNGITYVTGSVCATISGPGPYKVEAIVHIPDRTCGEKHKIQPVGGVCP